MAITHFSIPQLPDPNVVISTIDGNPLLQDTLYPIASEELLSFSRTPAFSYVSVSENFNFKVHDSNGDEFKMV